MVIAEEALIHVDRRIEVLKRRHSLERETTEPGDVGLASLERLPVRSFTPMSSLPDCHHVKWSGIDTIPGLETLYALRGLDSCLRAGAPAD